ncbi:MAG: DUF2203 domain-containing protein [Thaumarchaeota archaeon]|jgi:hypothetical protein|nr:MAG: DUF2203 domain-containing protein [Nitrososphaerota archaeon]HIA09931.1 DUF2203 family protein [Candidatus Nitrosopelagicus sp.]HIC06064.1 DUF2203 family protein [Candidatus Nitrosopelagicus sp.]|tara:strand:- start:2850 stop:3251 length:402 start_codon:yes stop_codon:yes gene_type:complete
MTTYFSISDANKILPSVIKKFNYSKMLKNEIIKMEKQMSLDLTSKTSMKDYIILKQKLNAKVTEFYQSIEDLESIGVVLKGLEQGLLDFPAKRFDEEIWLCWKEGETEIKFWHEKDSGFMGRKPISVSNESLV